MFSKRLLQCDSAASSLSITAPIPYTANLLTLRTTKAIGNELAKPSRRWSALVTTTPLLVPLLGLIYYLVQSTSRLNLATRDLYFLLISSGRSLAPRLCLLLFIGNGIRLLIVTVSRLSQLLILSLGTTLCSLSSNVYLSETTFKVLTLIISIIYIVIASITSSTISLRTLVKVLLLTLFIVIIQLNLLSVLKRFFPLRQPPVSIDVGLPSPKAINR